MTNRTRSKKIRRFILLAKLLLELILILLKVIGSLVDLLK